MYERPPSSPIFPYATLFRSQADALVQHGAPPLGEPPPVAGVGALVVGERGKRRSDLVEAQPDPLGGLDERQPAEDRPRVDRKSTRLNSSHANISYAVFCLNK